MTEEIHIGDGVHISLDSGMLRLRTQSGDDPYFRDIIIYLEPETLDAINEYAVKIGFPIKAVAPKPER